MTTVPPRPRATDTEVKTEAAIAIFGDVQAWMSAHKFEPAHPDTVRSVFALAVIENDDPYMAAKYLEVHCGWPVNIELVRLLDRTYSSLSEHLKPFIHDWVMQNKVRFTAKEGQDLRAKIGGVEFMGLCVGAVAHEARGFIETRTGKVIPVLAEDVVEVFKTKRPNKGGNPPTGGTPMASTGAQLKEAAAA